MATSEPVPFPRTGSAPDAAPPRRPRIESIDIVRGIIIVLMALDHVHDFFGDAAIQPTDLAVTTAPLFFTRWITHLCAPVFFLLTGTSAWLTLRRMSKPALSRFLLARGLWLLFLEVVVMRFALQFNLDYQITFLTVLWGLGWAMIALAGLLWLPHWAIATVGIGMIVGHNLFDGVAADAFGAFAPLWTLLHAPGIVIDNGRSMVFAAYVLVPWVGVTAMGYVLGQAYERDAEWRRRLLSWLGIGLLVAFVVLRFINVYGDPVSWSVQKSPLWTVMSFLNTNKYPPSLLFLLMTLGPALLLLRVFEHGVPRWLQPALVIGKVPLFFYILHFYLIHLLAVLVSYLRYGSVEGLFDSPDLGHFPFTQPPGWPLGLPAIYLLWALVVVSLYPLCHWYAAVKRRRRDWWLGYL
jgi:uncharacterized membrane protein